MSTETESSANVFSLAVTESMQTDVIRSQVKYPRTSTIQGATPLVVVKKTPGARHGFDLAEIKKLAQSSIDLKSVNVRLDIQVMLERLWDLSKELLLEHADNIQFYKGDLEVLRIELRSEGETGSGRSVSLDIAACRQQVLNKKREETKRVVISVATLVAIGVAWFCFW